jgi:hypothetical protein
VGDGRTNQRMQSLIEVLFAPKNWTFVFLLLFFGSF